MAFQLLLVAFGASAIRRHPGVDEKLEIFSDAVRRVSQGKGSYVVTDRFAKLLEAWEGSSWSDAANFTSVIVQIEKDLIASIEDSHETIQGDLDNYMADMACKYYLVENAHAAAVQADQDANDAIDLEKIEVLKLEKAVTKLINLELILQRAKDKKAASVYTYAGGFDTSLEIFGCKFDAEVDNLTDGDCDKSFEEYKRKSDADVQKVEDEYTLEQDTWKGFADETDALVIERNDAKTAVETQYSRWVSSSVSSQEKWKDREQHICYQVHADRKSFGDYGLNSYSDSDVKLSGQTCTQVQSFPLSYQRQHTDFCGIEEELRKKKLTYETANKDGGQPDQDYELQVLHTILCILNRLDTAESNLTDTAVDGTDGLVATCEASEAHEQILPYTYVAKKDLAYCKTKATGEWCFSTDRDVASGGVFSSVGAETTFTAFKEGSATVPSCEDVHDGQTKKVEVVFSGHLKFRWREEKDPPLTQVAWDHTSAVYTEGFDEVSLSGKSFITENLHLGYSAWAAGCDKTQISASESTGWVSKSGSSFKKCAFPKISEYTELDLDTSENIGGVKYGLDGDKFRHFQEEIINQCK